MTSGIEYALGAMLLFGVGDVVYKRGVAAGAQPHHLQMVQSWLFLPTVALYGLFTGSLQFSAAAALWGGLAGVFALTGFYNFAHSLKSGSVSINAPIFRLSFVVTAALAVLLLGEPLTPYKVVGIGLALAAVWLLLGAPPPGGAARHETLSSLVRVLIATASIGIGNFIYKYGVRVGATPASLIAAQSVVFVVLSAALVGALDRRIRPSGAALRYAPWAGLVLALAVVFMVESLTRGQASVLVPIAQMGFVVAALLGFLLLREPFTLRKGAGLVTAFAALASLAHG
jgi:uncharacterized membrane protein